MSRRPRPCAATGARHKDNRENPITMSKTKALDLVKKDVTAIRQELRDLKKEMEESDEAQRAQLKANYDEFRKKYFRYFEPDDEPTDDDTDHPPPADQDGRWQLEKGGNKDPKTWKVVPMVRNPDMWKIVDDKDVNIADLYHTKENAQKAIDDAIAKAGPGTPTTPPPPPQPTPTGGETPYPAKSPKLASTQRGPTKRNYASGKASDMTIEKNVKEIEFPDHQFIVDVTLNAMEHEDNVSMKIGGTHMGSGWDDHGVNSDTGLCCLGYEPDHPTTHSCVVKGAKLGPIVGKRLKIAAIWRDATAHTELWTNTGGGWVKQLEGDKIGGFNPDSDTWECQLRIDGWKTEPTIHSAFVTAI